MTLNGGADVIIGGIGYLLDESYQGYTGKRCYDHNGETILANDLIGVPGQNLRNDRLRWFITTFNGEGQVVYNRDDPDSAGLFYQSEGLDFRIPGQFRLNKSAIAEQANVSAAGSTTKEGNADFTDITGTSSTSGTDRRLNVVADKVGHSASITPGAVNMQGDFYLYREMFSDYATTILGSNLRLQDGDGNTSGTTFVLKSQSSTARSATKSTGTHFTTGVLQRVEFYMHRSSAGAYDMYADVRIVDVTGANNNIIANKRVLVSSTAAPSTATIALQFMPKFNRDYQFWVSYSTSSTTTVAHLVIDKELFGADITENSAVIEVWNQTGGVSVATKTLAVTNTATALIGSIAWTAVAATDYRLRVKRNAGQQRIWVDKTVTTAKGNAAFVYDCLDFGAGQKVWLGGHVAGADTHGWVYNPSTDAWDDTLTLNDGAATTAATVRAMTHSDSLEYFLLSNNEVYTGSTSVTDDRYAYFSGASRTLMGMVICQERLILLAEDSSGVLIYSLPVDGTGTPYDLTTNITDVQTLTIAAGSKSPDTTLRQRMCAASGGARFFLNYADVTAKIYDIDASVSPMTYRQIADLGTGVKATSITFENGVTFVGGQFYGDATASDTDKLPRSSLWVIDQNGYSQRTGFMRRYSPDPRVPQFLVPYQTDLYILQGNYVWRYSLITGGLFLEYQLSPGTSSNERSLACLFGRTFALYSDEIWVMGSVATYRQSSAPGGNTFTTSISDLGVPGALKSLVKVDLNTDTLPSNTQVSVGYLLDGATGTPTPLGVATDGAKNTWTPDAVTFTTIQFVITPATLDGASTPTIKGLNVDVKAAEENETFSLVLLTGNQIAGGGEDKILQDTSTGNDRAQNVISLWRTGTPTTLIDGYADPTPGGSDAYRVIISDYKDERGLDGEGRVFVDMMVVR